MVHCWIVSMSGSHLCWTISGSLRTCWKEQLSFLCSSGCDQGNARKGWCCLCAIFVENAGSMQERHYLALCKLLGLEVKKQEERVWDPSSSFPVSPVENEVPLLNLQGKPIGFASLLRTRDLLPFGVCWSSWTLYQPCSLV